jgi:DNA phosphorothioation-dependent restriction protein DptG
MELMAEEFNSKRSIEVDNKQQRLSVTRILVKQFVRLAMKGHPKALFPALEFVDKHQKAAARRESQKRHLLPTREEISKMTDQERTDLYMQALKKANGEE